MYSFITPPSWATYSNFLTLRNFLSLLTMTKITYYEAYHYVTFSTLLILPPSLSQVKGLNSLCCGQSFLIYPAITVKNHASHPCSDG
jgi:hypothetical protein